MVEIVKSVEARGHILDCMIAQGVISFERRSTIDSISNKADRIRALMADVIDTLHPTSARSFVNALEEDYHWLAENIKEQIVLLSTDKKDDNTSASSVISVLDLESGKINEEIGLVPQLVISDGRFSHLKQMHCRLVSYG